MARKKKRQIVLSSEGFDEDKQYETFDEAYAALMSTLEPGGTIDLHEEHCALVVDGPDCTCTPHRMTKGAEA